MTGVVVSPVVPAVAVPARLGRSGGRASPNGHRPLPVPRLAAAGAHCRVYGLVGVDGSGRVADNTVVRALGWGPGTRLAIHEHGGLVLVTMDRQGVFSVGARGHLRLPAGVRRWCGLVAGDRVLLAADPEQGLLVVHPPAALAAMVAQFHRSVLGGEDQ